MMIPNHWTKLLIAVALPCGALASTVSPDTLDLNVTFTGDREVLLRDAHKEMHWPQPATITRSKGDFSYSVLPTRKNVQPVWERERPKRLKIDEPLPLLYRGFGEVGMGNFLSPSLLVSYTDLRSRNQSWGTEVSHRSTRDGFIGLLESSPIPQRFSTNEWAGWYKRFFGKTYVAAQSNYTRNLVSYYGRAEGFHTIDSVSIGSGDSVVFNAWHAQLEFGSQDQSRQKWKHQSTVDYGVFWNDQNVKEQNLDARFQLQGSVEETPVSLVMHANIDRLNRNSEGFILTPQKQAVFDLHTLAMRDFNQLKTSFGFGMWVDAQGQQPFLFVPEIEASIGLLQNLFVPYVKLGGGIDQNRYETVLAENPFVPSPSPADSGQTWQNTYETIHLQAGMRGSITSAIAFHVSAEHSRRNQHLFWAPNTHVGDGAYFRPLYQDLSITTLQANATWKLGQSTEFIGEVQQHTYTVRDSSFNEMSAWNLPTFEVNGSVQHTIKQKLRILTSLNVKTGRRGLKSATLDVNDPEVIETSSATAWGYAYEMNDFLQWDVRIDYLYNARLNAWVSGQNLLNQANPIFAGYNGQGTRFQLGFSIAF